MKMLKKNIRKDPTYIVGMQANRAGANTPGLKQTILQYILWFKKFLGPFSGANGKKSQLFFLQKFWI